MPYRYRSPEEDSGRWDGFPFRSGDIVISTRSKSGTTWMQMICALLIFQRPELPQPLGDLSPWLDHLITPREEVYARLDAQRHRRFIKTHTPLDGIPLDTKATYIVVARHPLDAAVSMYHQGNNIDRDRLRELTGNDTPESVRPPLADWLRGWIAASPDPRQEMDSLPGVLWHLSDAWTRRDEPNILLVHYADLAVDLDGEMRRIADRLGIPVNEQIMPTLVDAATFDRMKTRADQLVGGVLKRPAASSAVAGPGLVGSSSPSPSTPPILRAPRRWRRPIFAIGCTGRLHPEFDIPRIYAEELPVVDPGDDARRVLIAEDEALIRLDLKEMLEEEGWTVVGEAADGEQAIALASELKPDLVILDVKMPKADGIAVAEHVAGNRIAPVVILTAFSQRDLVERARDVGAMAYIVKPFAKKDLLPTIEMATSRFAEITTLEAEVEGLQDRLEARKAVDRAKGVLMTEHGMTEPEAFRWIQRTAMDRRTTMRAVADAVVTSGVDLPSSG